MEIPVFNANSVDPDQTPRFAASDLGMRCWSITLMGVSRLKYVRVKFNKTVEQL